VRFIAGIVETPAGDMGVASVHLKCCGSAESPEDERRLAEAESINAELAQAFAEAPIRVVGGDLNLVGSPEAMHVLRSGLDVDGADLTVAEALVLGDRIATTWSNPRGRFAPSRLDFALVGDAAAGVSQAFVLDSRILTNAALSEAGLEGADTDASDHLPLVVDIRPR
jgi:endonuclease/exonuclease/phosphatase family metal-dependent hydrolase